MQGFVIAWIVSQVANKVFFGRLMDSEVEVCVCVCVCVIIELRNQGWKHAP